jgi:tetratricopeptide (TPR) repeat protein
MPDTRHDKATDMASKSEKFRELAKQPVKYFSKKRGAAADGMLRYAKMFPQTDEMKIKRLKLVAAKGAAASGFALLQLIAWLAKTLAADNPLIIAAERKFSGLKAGKKDGAAKKFVWKYPSFNAYMYYYLLLLAGMIAGNAGGIRTKFSDRAKQALVRTIGAAKNVFGDDENAAGDMSPAFDKSGPVRADMENFASANLEKYFDEIAIGLTELETYRAKPKRHGKESRYTNGLGGTWTYSRRGGRLVQKPNDKDTKANTKDENYGQLRMHLEHETLPAAQRALSGKGGVSENIFIGIVWAGSQRPADMAGIADGIESAASPQQVAEAFQHYGAAEKWRAGTMKRRWISAAFAVGAITLDDLKKMDRDAFSNLDINNIYRGGRFLLGREVVRFVLSRTNGNDTVEEFLQSFSAGRKILKDAGAGAPTPAANFAEVSAGIEKSTGSMNAGDSLFRAKEYAKAADLYRLAIDEDPDNMEAYSSLSLAYKRLGDKLKSVEYYEKSAEAVVAGNRRMNANKSLLLDYAVKASSYYNAGLAREAIGDLQKAHKKHDVARKNYDLAVRNYKNALENYKKAEEDPDYDPDRIAIYENAGKNVEGKLKELKNAQESKIAVQKKAGLDDASAKVMVWQANQSAMRRGRGG